MRHNVGTTRFVVCVFGIFFYMPLIFFLIITTIKMPEMGLVEKH